MNWNDIESQVRQMNDGLRDLMSNIVKLSAQSDKYPIPSEDFNSVKKSIEQPNYDIVICGEVKKGKSSLLNSIIGKDILPVDCDVATAQVFRVTNSSEESYSLVFTDGTSLPITYDELSRYGSQVEINRTGETGFTEKILSHIQINTPVEFLPENVSLVDTPGLGAVYKSHEWLTRNYVKKVAAVLFVFDALTPLVALEEEFIKKVLDITPYIMFVMTKIDLKTPSEWTSQLRRTEESLSKIFESCKQPAPIVFPVSGETLKQASKTKKRGL